jgi:hypothetical protein
MANQGGNVPAGGAANVVVPAINALGGARPEGAAADAPGANVLTQIENDEAIMAIVARMKASFGVIEDDVQAGGDITTGDYTLEDMKTVMLESVNGDQVMQEQRVRVDFLRADQRMIIPLALGMHPVDGAQVARVAPYEATLSARYLRARGLTYAQIRQYSMTSTPFADILQAVNALALPEAQQRGIHQAWTTAAFYVYDGNRRDNVAVENVAFAYLSMALGFNCDIRDTGFLMQADARCADGAWLTIGEVTDARIASKLKPFSLMSIAALNYAPTGNSALGGWIRAYGLSTGLLPDAASICHKEYRFTLSQPAQQVRTHVAEFKKRYESMLHPLCMNILAMFGLLHLNKDHTYRPTDTNMERICTSYIETLRTLVYEHNTDFLKQQMEVVCRTGPHPFGLGQTYFLARLMHNYAYLAPALMIRYDVAPPPIQRFMIVSSVVDQWSALPAGQKLNESFHKVIKVIDNEVARIKSSPPSFSGLHAYYGIDNMFSPEKRAWRAVEALMPCVFGFAMVLHGERGDQKEKLGVALALSLKNVERDAKAIAMMFVSLWEQYLTTTESAGLVNFAVSSAKLLTGMDLEGDEEEQD